MRGLPPVAITAIVFVVGFALCAVQFPNFASTRVAANLLTDNAFLGIVATGMTFVIISGGIDLSVGSVIGFTTVFVALAIERLGVPPLVAFVAILMQPKFGSGNIAINQTSIGIVLVESPLRGCGDGEVQERGGQGGPRSSRVRIQAGISIPAAVRNPTYTPAICHRNRHGMASRGYEVAERRSLCDSFNFFQQCGCLSARKAAQKNGTGFQRLIRAG